LRFQLFIEYLILSAGLFVFLQFIPLKNEKGGKRMKFKVYTVRQNGIQETKLSFDGDIQDLRHFPLLSIKMIYPFDCSTTRMVCHFTLYHTN